MRRGCGAAAGLAALPFGVLGGWLRWRGWLAPAPAAWMLYWLCAALLVWLLYQGPPAAAGAYAPDALAGLGPCLAGACALCLFGALAETALCLPAPAAAVLTGGVCAAAAWLLLCVVGLACLWRDKGA